MANRNGAFRAMHKIGDPFVLANAWDAGSAKMLEYLGARAIGTTSYAHAFSMGRHDGGHVTRDEALSHAQDLVAAVSVPVSGDFENGYGDDPDACAQTVRASGEIGLAGMTLEDESFTAGDAYDFDLAVERVAAAASAARALPGDFVLVARAEGVLNKRYDLAEALRRIRAYDAAGADCIYVPGLPDEAALRAVVGATDKPVNALVAGPIAALSRARLAEIGVARISLGSTLARVALKGLFEAASTVLRDGDFRQMSQGLGADVLSDILDGKGGS